MRIHSILNRMVDAHVPIHEEICCIVVDELHLFAKDDRGALLQILISKLRYHSTLELSSIHSKLPFQGLWSG